MLKLGMEWLDAFKVAPLALAIGVGSVSLEAAAQEKDPWESTNRSIMEFNDTLDKYALKPIAQGYRDYTPEIMQTGIHNAYNNIGDLANMLNNLMQGKPREAGVDTSRFLFNSTIGVLGFVDVATRMGLERNDEDFGQTLGVWGVESGPYVVLPFFGPSSVRDGLGKIPDAFMSPYPYMDDDLARNGLFALSVVDTRANLLSAEKMITGDRYIFIRNAYLENREFKVQDGKVVDDF